MRISPGFPLAVAASLLIAPLRLTLAVLLAAAMHELGHLTAFMAFRTPVDGIRIGAFGAEIRAHTERLSYGRELAATLAGPAVNLVCAPLFGMLAARTAWEWGYLFAGAHILLGIYNLLPVPQLDGGRALYLSVAWRFGPDAGERIGTAAGGLTSLLLLVIGVHLTLAHGGVLFLAASAGLFFGVFWQIWTCEKTRQRVKYGPWIND